MIEVDYSEKMLCDSCYVDYKRTLYDIWIDGECIVTLCDNCIDKLMEQIEILKGRDNNRQK